MEQPIVLNTTADEIRAIYFKDQRLDVFCSVDTRQARRHFLWTLLLALVLVGIGLAHGQAYGLYWIAAAALFGKGAELLVEFNRIWKHRRRIDAWALSVERAGPAKLWVSDSGFTLDYDGKETIERWSGITHVTIAGDHVHLFGHTTYLLPKSSMRSEQFEELVKFIKERINEPSRMQSVEKSSV